MPERSEKVVEFTFPTAFQIFHTVVHIANLQGEVVDIRETFAYYKWMHHVVPTWQQNK